MIEAKPMFDCRGIDSNTVRLFMEDRKIINLDRSQYEKQMDRRIRSEFGEVLNGNQPEVKRASDIRTVGPEATIVRVARNRVSHVRRD